MPEINFTLPVMSIDERTWPDICRQYRETASAICQRAIELEVPELLMEFETLPPMTSRPEWALEITTILADTLRRFHERSGLKSALRLTPNDNRDHERPPRLRSGPYWEAMRQVFEGAAKAGADLLAIESTGGKEVWDQALMTADLKTMVFALGVLAARDVEFVWGEIVGLCQGSGIVPSGDTACGFANTAMVLAEQKLIPRVLAAVLRVAAVPRSLMAYGRGAVGPSKDCAYEGPYLKAIAGVPISMEGRTAACAHLSPVGNIAQAVCDCWSNESVQNVRLLSTNAPTVCLEQLAYDCRLMNLVLSRPAEQVRQFRDYLVDSDAGRDPQAFVLRPDVVLRISQRIVAEPTAYRRTRTAVLAALEEIRSAVREGRLRLSDRETRWLGTLTSQALDLPESEEQLMADVMSQPEIPGLFRPAEYGLLL